MLNNFKYGFTITARTKSTRLRKKVLRKVGDYLIIEHTINRLKKKFNKNKICLITSKFISDRPLVEIAKKNEIKFFTGYPLDVMSRIYFAAKKNDWDYILSTTGDNPFVDQNWAYKLLKHHIKNKNDYTFMPNISNGFDSVAVTRDVLKKTIKLKQQVKTEFWPTHIKENKIFKVGKFYTTGLRDFKNLRITLDTKEDFKFIREIYLKINKKIPTNKEIIQLVKKNPRLRLINKNIKQMRPTKPKFKIK